jgi:diadenosine tetraphosphate (Ap4A) HIT family hydrolase
MYKIVVLVLTLCATTVSANEVFQLQGVDKDHKIVAGADGLSIRVTWKKLEPNKNRFDWTYLDKQVKKARDAKVYYRIRLMAQIHSPAWTTQHWIRVKPRPNLAAGVIPVPWARDYMRNLGRTLKQICQRYYNDKLFIAVDVPGVWESAEWHTPQELYQHPGYTDVRMANAIIRRVKVLNRFAPPHCLVIMNHSYTKYSDLVLNRVYRMRRPVGCQMNALKADTNTHWVGFTKIRDWYTNGKPAGFQMVGPSQNRERFGGTLLEAINKASPWARWYEVYRGDVKQAKEFLR